jgi:FKBP-type peptidyl-prolyl cis-trans isomerase SlyD
MAARNLTFHYTLRDENGRVLDTSAGAEPLTFEEGAGMIVPGLESVLVAMQVGEKRHVVVAPEDGYGPHDPALVQYVDRSRMPVNGEIKVGDQFQAGPDRQAPIVTVVQVEADRVLLDANHPMSGRTLYFDVELLAASS